MNGGGGGVYHQHRNGTTTTINGNPSYQLRSKTPTTDRMLFAGSSNPNDYLYLNGNTQAPKQSANPHVDQLYSTVSSHRTNKMMLDQLDNGVNTMVISQRPQPVNGGSTSNGYQSQPAQSHVPIYDSTTNIQHQRVMHSMKPNTLHTGGSAAVNNINGGGGGGGTNPLSNRSKTPGPDMIYFRNDLNAYQNGHAPLNGKFFC